MRLRDLVLAGVLVMPLGATVTPALADDAAGEFSPCLACHSLDPDIHNLPGPNLAGLQNRPVGGDSKFAYSPALKTAREAGMTWSRTLLDRFLKDPEGLFPGMWMSYPGLDDASKRAALADFILSGGIPAD